MKFAIRVIEERVGYAEIEAETDSAVRQAAIDIPDEDLSWQTLKATVEVDDIAEASDMDGSATPLCSHEN